MLVKELASIFEALADNASLHKDVWAAEEFREVAAALGKQRRTLKLKEAETYWSRISADRSDSHGGGRMTARRAADHLRIVAETANPVARKGALSPLREFVAFLHERGDAPVATVVADLVRPLPQKDWLVQLKAAGTNRRAFDQTVAEMIADKAIDADALNVIAQGYTGIGRRSRSKKELVERITDQFESDAQYASKVDAIDRMTGGR